MAYLKSLVQLIKWFRTTVANRPYSPIYKSKRYDDEVVSEL